MTPEKARSQTNLVSTILRAGLPRTEDEATTRAKVIDLLEDHGLHFADTHLRTANGMAAVITVGRPAEQIVVDFAPPDVAKNHVIRQVTKYAGLADVHGVVLVTNDPRHASLPGIIKGTPVRVALPL